MPGGRPRTRITDDSPERSAFPEHAPTPEADWLSWAASRPSLWIGASRAVVVAPHPDDETLGCGGLIADLCRRDRVVQVVTVTDGEGSHPGSEGIRALRRTEQARALRTLGVKTDSIRLGFPDSGIATVVGELADRLGSLVERTDVLLAPWAHDGHTDHDACAGAATIAAKRVGCRLLAYPIWAWQWATPDDLDATPWGVRTMSEAAHIAKLAAIRCYESQTTDLLGTVIVPPPALMRFRRHFEVFTDVR